MNSSTSSFRRHRPWLWLWLAFGLIPALALFGATETMLRIFVAPKDNRLAHYRLFKNSTAHDAAFGDSQMAATVTGVPGMVNLAHAGENYVITAYRVRTYFQTRTPHRVILQANPNNFAKYREQLAVSSWTPRYIAGLEKLNENVFMSSLPLFRMYIWDYWQVLLNHGGFKSKRYITSDGAQFRPGSLAMSVTPAKFEKLVRVRLEEQTPPDDFSDLVTYRAFISTLDFLKKRGAEVCLVTTPMPPSYRADAKNNPVFRRVLDRFDALARQYGFGRANMWDAVNDLNLFADTDHLNERGAKRIVPVVMDRCFGSQAAAR